MDDNVCNVAYDITFDNNLLDNDIRNVARNVTSDDNIVDDDVCYNIQYNSRYNATDEFLPMTYGILSDEYSSKHLGPNAKYSKDFGEFSEVEAYIRKCCDANGVSCSFDVTAQENPYFRTINYTSFAGMVIIHPLDFSQSIFQMYDARQDCLPDAGHIEFIRNRLLSGRASKYVSNRLDGAAYDAVAVLCGHNKFKAHIDARRLDDAVRRYGKRLAIKPHPISQRDLIDYLSIYKDFATILDLSDDVYDAMQSAQTVYTTHISETALAALILGKRIEPLDHMQNRLSCSFGHINHFCFTERDPVSVIGSVFASSKSGVICPQVDVDWKSKVDEYFDYSMWKREKQKGFYHG